MKEQLKKIEDKVDLLMENQIFVKANLAEHIKRTDILQEYVEKNDNRLEKQMDRLVGNLKWSVGTAVAIIGIVITVFEYMKHS